MDTFHTVIFLPKTLVPSKTNGGIGRTELYVAVFDLGKATQVVENQHSHLKVLSIILFGSILAH